MFIWCPKCKRQSWAIATFIEWYVCWDCEIVWYTEEEKETLEEVERRKKLLRDYIKDSTHPAPNRCRRPF